MSKKSKQKKEIKIERTRSLFGRILRIPSFILYLVFSVILGSVIGALSAFVFPFYIPFTMVKIRYFNGT